MKRFLQAFFLLVICFASKSAFSQEDSPHELMRKAREAFEQENWGGVTQNTYHILKEFPDSPFTADALYFFGYANYKKKNYTVANRYLSLYLSKEGASKYFEDAVKGKFLIAKDLYEGQKVQLLGKPHLPRVESGDDFALTLFDEVITTLPRHECAAEALFYKGKLLAKMKEYKESIDAYESLIRRFPMNRLAPESYLEIGKVYIHRCEGEFPDQDLLELAKINYEKFTAQFPTEPRLRIAHLQLLEIEEVLSSELFEIASFYERTGKKRAAQVYYSSVINRYPATVQASKSKKRLKAMHMTVLKQGEEATLQEKVKDAVVAGE